VISPRRRLQGWGGIVEAEVASAMDRTETPTQSSRHGASGQPGSSAPASGPHGVSGLLREILTVLSSRGAQPGPAAEILQQHLNNLDEKLNLVLAEHEGMGNDLLQTYEQLSIVFEITRQLATVTDEDQVMEVFIGCLRAMFHKCCFATARNAPREDIRVCFWGPADFARDDVTPISVVVDRCAATHKVEVVDCEGDMRQIMACPICAGDIFVCALVLIRREDSRAFTSADMLLMDSLSLFCGDIIRKLRLLHELRQMSIDMVRTLVETIDQKDDYTSGHSNRVARYARMLARGLGWPDERLQTLEWAALLHDVGKIGIRDDVLKKAGKLTTAEFDHMKEHPVRSSEVVCRVPHLAGALDGVLHHHEHWDGSGYPDRLAGEDIPLQARIIQTADIFDALTTDRSYRKAFTWQKALSILREESGTVVDPNLAAVFETLILDLAAKNREEFERTFEAGASGVNEEVGPVRVGANPGAPEPFRLLDSPSRTNTTNLGGE